jgi:hypothetical protein
VDKIWRFADANEIVDLLASHIAAQVHTDPRLCAAMLSRLLDLLIFL